MPHENETAAPLLDDDARVIAETLRSIEPDRGNYYATRTVRTKGEAAHAQWVRTCRTLATVILRDGRRGSADRRAFLRACGIENEEG